jgi:predicted nucleic acid-binding Zn ribbon protein
MGLQFGEYKRNLKKVECLLNCPNCGKEILDEDASFCPKCGEPLAPEDEIEQNLTDLVLAAGILTIIAAAFSSGLGYIAIYQYTSLLSYYGHSLLQGFLILGVFGIVASAFGLVGGVFMLQRKRIKVSMLGVILLLASVFVTYINIQQYQYGFTDILLFSEIAIFIFSILSGVLVFTSKTEFA